jgi:hypothetical protein
MLSIVHIHYSTLSAKIKFPSASSLSFSMNSWKLAVVQYVKIYRLDI